MPQLLKHIDAIAREKTVMYYLYILKITNMKMQMLSPIICVRT